jgi:hypothetical protein
LISAANQPTLASNPEPKSHIIRLAKMKSKYLAVFTRNNSDSNRSNSSGDDRAHKYEAIPTADRERQDRRSLTEVDVETQAVLEEHLRSFRKRNKRKLVIIIIGAIGLIVFFYLAVA